MAIIYECGICDCYHPWEWNGDCREDTDTVSDGFLYGMDDVAVEYALKLISS